MLNEAPRRWIDGAEADLAARAAWLHYAGGMTQGQVARRLGVSSIKAHRLIARATREGLVRIVVDAEVSECVALEDAFRRRFGLDFCHVAPDLHEEAPLPLKALAVAGATFLKNEIERGATPLIGIGHGRTLAAAVAALAPVSANGTRFVSMFGGLSRRFAASPYDVIHRLAEKTGGEAYQIPLPTFAKSVADRDVLLAQPGIAEVFELALSAPLVFAGIGDLADDAFLVSSEMLGAEEVADLRAKGAVGELLGHYFGADGAPVALSLSERALAPSLARLTETRVIAIAGGAPKVGAVGAALKSGVLDGLVTDEATARAVLAAAGAPA